MLDPHDAVGPIADRQSVAAGRSSKASLGGGVIDDDDDDRAGSARPSCRAYAAYAVSHGASTASSTRQVRRLPLDTTPGVPVPTSQFDLTFENIAATAISRPSRRRMIASSPISMPTTTCWMAVIQFASPFTSAILPDLPVDGLFWRHLRPDVDDASSLGGSAGATPSATAMSSMPRVFCDRVQTDTADDSLVVFDTGFGTLAGRANRRCRHRAEVLCGGRQPHLWRSATSPCATGSKAAPLTSRLDARMSTVVGRLVSRWSRSRSQPI